MSTAKHESLSRYVIDTDFKRSLLNSIALFRGVDPDALGDLLSACGRIDIDKGQVVLSPDKKNHCVYVVLSGALEVHIGSKDSAKIADLPPGTCAGEMSLIEDKDPSAYVIASENSHLMVISHGLLWQMVDRSHAFSKNLLIVLSERVRSDNEFIASSLGILRQAERNAMTDALTGLGNRHWMQNMFDRELKRLQRAGLPGCVLMIDIDNFKQFNDQYGHIAGDRVLAAVAQILRDRLRPTDLVARFGGDEFAALLPGLELVEGIQAADRLIEDVARLSPANLSNPVTISVGVADAYSHDEIDTLVNRADAAMYRAKDAGRNRAAS